MRLIDADALIQKVETARKKARTLTGMDFVMVTEKQPTIDAIPVEWLRKWPKDLREGAYVRDILRDWQKEQGAGA